MRTLTTRLKETPPPQVSEIVIASRRSRLAMWQSEFIARMVRQRHPDIETRILELSTKGDADQRPFEAIGGKGLFVTEVERAVQDGRADIAVHSAKDLTAELAPGCSLVCVPLRAAPEDVVVGGTGATGEERLGRLPDKARVGTSSLRRRALLAEARPDLDIVEFRGNLDTRLAKVAAGEVDAAILARAGIERLNMTAAGELAALASDWWVAAPGQGALAVEALTEREDLAQLFAPLNDEASRAELLCERAFSQRLEGGCTVPLGCTARVSDGRMVVNGFLGLPDGSRGIRDRISGPLSDAESLGRELAEAIYAGGGDEILEELRYEEEGAE
jgi:hydroxymethylbilane synthase